RRLAGRLPGTRPAAPSGGGVRTPEGGPRIQVIVPRGPRRRNHRLPRGAFALMSRSAVKRKWPRKPRHVLESWRMGPPPSPRGLSYRVGGVEAVAAPWGAVMAAASIRIAAFFFRRERTIRRTATTIASTTTTPITPPRIGNGRIWAETSTVTGADPGAPRELTSILSTSR